MISLFEILTIIFIHWFADFVLQTSKQAEGKSKSLKPLLNHTLIYSSVWIPVITFLFYVYKVPLNNMFIPMLFFLITFIAHTTTDFISSRMTSRLWKANKVHEFFVVIGFDQVLHYIQLFLTYWYLKNLLV